LGFAFAHFCGESRTSLARIVIGHHQKLIYLVLILGFYNRNFCLNFLLFYC
jgi:hypothetical protein